MRQVRDKVAFFEELSNKGKAEQDECGSQANSMTGSLVESNESFDDCYPVSSQTTSHIAGTTVPGKKILYPGAKENASHGGVSSVTPSAIAGLSSRGTTDIFSMFSGSRNEAMSSHIANTKVNKGRNGQLNASSGRNNLANGNFSTGFYSRHSQETKSQQASNDSRVVEMLPKSTCKVHQHQANPVERFGQMPSSPSSLRFSGTGVMGNTEQFTQNSCKRNWSVANGTQSRRGQDLVPISEHALDERKPPNAAPTTLHRKLLNGKEKNLMETVLGTVYSGSADLPQKASNSLPEPSNGSLPSKGSSEAKLSYAKRMHAGYLRSTGRGTFVPKRPRKWGTEPTEEPDNP